MSWNKKIDELRRREALAEKMGGADKLKRQKDRGKLWISCSMKERFGKSARLRVRVYKFDL